MESRDGGGYAPSVTAEDGNDIDRAATEADIGVDVVEHELKQTEDEGVGGVLIMHDAVAALDGSGAAGRLGAPVRGEGGGDRQDGEDRGGVDDELGEHDEYCV